MRQQINLYQRARTVRMPVSASSLLVASTALVAALLSIWVYGQFAVTRLQRQVEALERQQQAQATLATAAQALYSEKIDATTLHAQVAELQQSLADRDQALLLLRARPAIATQGFAVRLQALAHPHIDGVWLDGVVLNERPGIQRLTGRSLNAELVAKYLRALGGERALTGTRFTDVRIQNAKYVEVDKREADAGNSDADNTVGAAPTQTFTGVRFRVDSPINTATLASAVTGGVP
jgi:multidrug efflux pump subunit AcrA (membrane-fusion protein)